MTNPTEITVEILRDSDRAILVSDGDVQEWLPKSQLEYVGEVCAETLRRIMHGEPVCDRYLLGLAWAIRDMEENKDNFFKEIPF